MQRPMGVRGRRNLSPSAIAAVAGTYDPAVLSLSHWNRASFTASPWAGTASAGSSGSRSLTEATNPPASGAAVNGYTPADFDGTDDILASATDTATIFGSSGSFAALVYIDTAPAASGTDYADGTLLSDNTSAEVSIGVVDEAGTSKLVACVLEGGTTYIRAEVACTTGAWHLVQCKWDGANLKVRVDSGSWTSTACGTVTLTAGSQPTVGSSYVGLQLDGKVLEIMTSNTALADGDFTNLITYVNSRYALSL